MPGDVLYRLSYNQTLINRITAYITDAFKTESSPSALFIATWNRVPQSSKILFNTFQVVIAADNNKNTTFVLFLYEDIQWSDSFSEAGFNPANMISGGHHSLEDITVDLDTLSNIGQSGIFAFRVDQEKIQFPGNV